MNIVHVWVNHCRQHNVYLFVRRRLKNVYATEKHRIGEYAYHTPLNFLYPPPPKWNNTSFELVMRPQTSKQ